MPEQRPPPLPTGQLPPGPPSTPAPPPTAEDVQAGLHSSFHMLQATIAALQLSCPPLAQAIQTLLPQHQPSNMPAAAATGPEAQSGQMRKEARKLRAKLDKAEVQITKAEAYNQEIEEKIENHLLELEGLKQEHHKRVERLRVLRQAKKKLRRQYNTLLEDESDDLSLIHI